jgi:thioredoxin reductase
MSRTPHVVIVGAGPAGLTAARHLRAGGAVDVTVLDREGEPGGAPRHTDHLGFGLRDLHRLTTGPRYARRLVDAAERAGATVRASTTVIDIESASGQVRTTQPMTVVTATGERLAADAVVLATGVRERPRSARLVAGDRPRGVFTTGSVQQLTALHHRRVGSRAVVVGAEHVSFSAIWSLEHGGCSTVAMVTPLPHHQTVAPLRWATASRRRVAIHTGVDVDTIVGRERVEAVVLTDGTRIDCDTVVFTGDWVPEYELVRRAGLALTPGARGPATDRTMRTETRGMFAIGNLVHPAEAADRCALDGVHVAGPVHAWLADRQWPETVHPIAVTPPLRWATWCAGNLTVRTDSFVTGRLQVLRNGLPLVTGRRRDLVPNRALVVRGAELDRLAEADMARLAVQVVR